MAILFDSFLFYTQDDSDLVFDDELTGEGTWPVSLAANNRVKREPPPLLEAGRKARRSTASGNSKLASHGLWQTKKKQHKEQQTDAVKSSNGKKHNKSKHSIKSKKSVVKIHDDEDMMLADGGSGSGDGPEIPLPPIDGGSDTKSMLTILACLNDFNRI